MDLVFRRLIVTIIWLVGLAALGVALASPARADTTVTVRMPDCDGCTITAVSSVHPGWHAIDESRTIRRSATVHRGIARLHVPTARTRGLAFEVHAGRYSAGNAVAMAVMRYAGLPVGARVDAGRSSAAGEGSFCWAGTGRDHVRLTFRSHRTINRAAPSASPDRYIIRVWSRTGRATLRDDLNMHATNSGGLGVQQGPYCFDDRQTASGQRMIPAGRTYLRTPGDPSASHRLLVVRRGASIRYSFLPSAGTPGCFRGTFAGGQLLGDSVSLYTSGLQWDSSPQTLQVGLRSWQLNGQRWRVVGAGRKHASLRRALDATLRRCDGAPWPAAAAPVPGPGVPTPVVPVSPTPPPPAPPPPTTPAPPPPPPAATIVVNTCNTYNNCDYWNPIWVHANPAVSSHIGDVGRGTALTARCWARGITLTDGSNQTTDDDARQFTSSLWYGIDWNGGRGYVPAVWTTKREDHLGLPAC